MDTIPGDPQFVDPSADDYHLKLSSPWKDYGTDTLPGGLTLPVTDLDGRPRNLHEELGARCSRSGGLPYAH